MVYDISGPSAPQMPAIGNGTECIRLLLSQTSKEMHDPLFPMLFPLLGSHISGAQFQYPDLTWKEPCGLMANLVAETGAGKGQLTLIVEAVNRSFRQHDREELDKLIEWQRQVKTKSANKEKPARPEVAFWFPPADVTTAAFLQNAMACENLGGRTQYINAPEVEMIDRMCGGHRQISQMLRNIYDRQRSGALRATEQGVTGNPVLRVNITLSSTPFATRQFYRSDLFNGTFGRMVFSYKARGDRDGRIPRQGRYSDDFLAQLDPYLQRLHNCQGRHIIHPLNKLTDRLAADMASLADLADDDILWACSKRALVSAWKAGCIMWVLNGNRWSRTIGDLVEWLVYHDLWSKMQLFADLLGKDAPAAVQQRPGPGNMLDSLPDTFGEAQLRALRVQMGKTPEGTSNQLRKWVFRHFVTLDPDTSLYRKTEQYLTKPAKQ